GSARPIADNQARHPHGRFHARPRNRSRPKPPNGAPAPPARFDHPSQSPTCASGYPVRHSETWGAIADRASRVSPHDAGDGGLVTFSHTTTYWASLPLVGSIARDVRVRVTPSPHKIELDRSRSRPRSRKYRRGG